MLPIVSAVQIVGAGTGFLEPGLLLTVAYPKMGEQGTSTGSVASHSDDFQRIEDLVPADRRQILMCVLQAYRPSLACRASAPRGSRDDRNPAWHVYWTTSGLVRLAG